MSPTPLRLARPAVPGGVVLVYRGDCLVGMVDPVGEGYPYYEWEFFDYIAPRFVGGFAGSLADAVDAIDAERWRSPRLFWWEKPDPEPARLRHRQIPPEWQGDAEPEPKPAKPAEIVTEDPAMVARIARRRAGIRAGSPA